MPSSSAAGAVVVGRYAGVVDVLAGILQRAGVEVIATAALDGGGAAEVRRVLGAGDGASVVVTVAPSDASLGLVLAAVAPDRVVAVTWHPADERPRLPAQVTLVEAGRIHRDLAAAVSASR